MNRQNSRRYFLNKLVFSCTLLCLFSAVAHASDEAAVDGIVFSISSRTPDQLVAFYSARGFPANALQYLTRRCFLTIGIRNRRQDVVWLELTKWRFIDAQGREVQRIRRNDWDQRWKEINLPKPARAAFGWTQLPESRDLQPDEPIGGNVALLPPQGSFTLQANFRIGHAKNGRVVSVRVPDLTCPAGEKP